MAFRRIIAAAASVALMATPTLASAQASASASTAASTAATPEVAPAAETVEGEQLRGGFIIPLIALIAVILGLCAADVICSDNEDLPTSP